MLDLGKEHEGYFIKHDLVSKYENGRELLVLPKAMQRSLEKRMMKDILPKLEEFVIPR